MSRQNAKILIFSLVLIIILNFFYIKNVPCENSPVDAEQTILDAEVLINEAFISVRMAEEAKAKIDDLIEKLNTALNFTLEAQTHLSYGNLSGAVILGSNAIEMAEEVANQANVRKQEASGISIFQRYRNQILFIITDAAICLVGIFLIHKWQEQSLMKKKPKLIR